MLPCMRIRSFYQLNSIGSTSVAPQQLVRVQCLRNEEGLENHYSNTVQGNIYITNMRWCMLSFTAVKHRDFVLSQKYAFWLQIWQKIKVFFGQAEVSRNITLLLEVWGLGLCSEHQWKSHFFFLSLLPSHSCLFGLQVTWGYGCITVQVVAFRNSFGCSLSFLIQIVFCIKLFTKNRAFSKD